MFIVQAILTLLSRYAGKVLNTLFGWATRMLFGKVPHERQIYLSLMSLGAMLWIIVALGIALPRFGVFVLSFVKLPPWIDKTWIRVGMLTATVAVPLFIGSMSLLMMEPQDRPRNWRGTTRALLKGYPYAAGLSLTLLWMLLFAPVMRLREAARGWTSTHVQILVEQDDYEAVILDLLTLMAAGGIPLQVERASWQMTVPMRIMTAFSGAGVFRNLVVRRLSVLQSRNMEVMLLPFDLILRGEPRTVGRARAVLAEQLTISRARLTWTKEANEFEDRLAQLYAELKRSPLHRPLGALVRDVAGWETGLKDSNLPYDEWEILFREKLLLEKQILSTELRRQRVGASGDDNERAQARRERRA